MMVETTLMLELEQTEMTKQQRIRKNVNHLSRKYPYSSHRWDWNFLKGGGGGDL